ncbi:MAG: hypothetical protein Q6363_010055 [Candidatus Njordarchaeota archaeon]
MSWEEIIKEFGKEIVEEIKEEIEKIVNMENLAEENENIINSLATTIVHLRFRELNHLQYFHIVIFVFLDANLQPNWEIKTFWQ